jgi:predicted nucleic acid-binding protein
MAKAEVPLERYYLDACVLLDLIEHPAHVEPAKTIVALFEDAAAGRFELVTSVLSIVEVLYAKEEKDRRQLDPAIEEKIRRLWHPGSSPVRIVEAHELVVKDAMRLLRDGIVHGWSKTGAIDAIHLATARRERATEFFTTEDAMNKWAEVIGVKVCAPHWSPAASSEQGELMFPPVSPPPVLPTGS